MAHFQHFGVGTGNAGELLLQTNSDINVAANRILRISTVLATAAAAIVLRMRLTNVAGALQMVTARFAAAGTIQYTLDNPFQFNGAVAAATVLALTQDTASANDILLTGKITTA